MSEEDEKKPKECYVFVDNDNPKAPIVLHFPLVNDTFQKYKSPGKELCLQLPRTLDHKGAEILEEESVSFFRERIVVQLRNRL